MVQLGEWSVVVELPPDVPDDRAVALSAAVTADLRRWASDAEERLGRDLGIGIRIRASDQAGL